MEDLIKVFQFSSLYRKGKLNHLICSIIMDRAADIKYREIRALMKILSNVKFPIQKESLIFEEMGKFINENFDSL